MKDLDLKINRHEKSDKIEFYTSMILEPNSSYEIENCIRDAVRPKKMEYRFDLWFDDNDSGYFIKDNLKVEISYGVMTDFIFYTDINYSEDELRKVEGWIKAICLKLLEKEKIRLVMGDDAPNPFKQENKGLSKIVSEIRYAYNYCRYWLKNKFSKK